MSTRVYVRIGEYGRAIEIGSIDRMDDVPGLFRSVADEWERQGKSEESA